MRARFSFAGLTGGNHPTLDVPVAALAGLSVAFLAFAAPAELLADLVGSTGLASILPAAEPPLGLKARIAIGAVGAVAIFVLAFLLLRWLDRFGNRPATESEALPAEMEPPRLRRRDAHPDAPPRAPLLATYDLGEPEAESETPRGTRRQGLIAAEAVAEEIPEPPVDEVLELEAPVAALPPEPLPEPEDFAAEEDFAAQEDFAAEGDFAEESAPAAAAGRPVAGDSITDLMARLEQGLARRRIVVPPVDPMAPETVADAPDERLQSAIESLQRLASRQQ